MSGAADVLGNPVSAASAPALEGIDAFTSGFLAFGKETADVVAAAGAHPDSALANAFAGVVAMFVEQPEALAIARRYCDRARAAARHANAREAAYVDLLDRWIIGETPQAQAIGEQILEAFPRDLVAVKLHQVFSLDRGDAPAMLRIARAALPANADSPHLHAMLAFGYEECHFLDEAERTANRALELDTREPWAQHAIAHVMLTQGRIPEGAGFLAGVADTWDGLNSFMYTHNWWHRALFDISLGDAEAVFEAYDRHCWAVDKDYSQDQIGAVSLLTRMEFAGLDVGERWSELGERLRARADDAMQPFRTLQYLYGLARAELGEADTLMQAVEDRAATARAHEKAVWAEVTVPACRGLLAHARGDWETAARELGAVAPRMMEVGGSHAQRDLFAQILLDAHIEAGHAVTAQQMLESRRRYDPNGVPLNRLLAATYDKLGLLDEAAVARKRSYH